jgi:uncharacterized membrane protein YdjX (TVP38/TMEM64 family)
MSKTRGIQLISVVAALVLLAIFLPVQDGLTQLYDWSVENPGQALAVYAVIVVFGMVLMVPISVLAMAAGFTFGLTKGILVIFLAGLAGSVLAFQLGRSLARPWIENRVSRRPDFAAVDGAIRRGGLLVVVLARLSLVLPYNLLNYSFGLTGVSLRDYVLGSAIGMLPPMFMFVFVGTTATNVAAIVNGELSLGDYDMLIGGFGILVIAVAVLFITRMARKALKAQLTQEIPE